MKQQTSEQPEVQAMTIYFPRHLLARVRKSAKEHRRSFSSESVFLLEQVLGQQSEQSSTSPVGAQR